MDATIVIEKGVIRIRRWNPETRSYETKLKREQSMLDVLQYPVEFKDTTFGQFFELIARDAEVYEKIFSASMGGCPIQPYIDELRDDPKEVANDVWFVRVYWGMDFFEGELGLYPNFDGYGKWDNQGKDDWPTEGGIALEYTPLNQYRDHELKLDKEVVIQELEPGSKPLVKAMMEFDVYDAIRAILFEITWTGDISKGRRGLNDDLQSTEPTD